MEDMVLSSCLIDLFIKNGDVGMMDCIHAIG